MARGLAVLRVSRVTAVTVERWAPDEQLVAAVLASPMTRRMSDLAAADRSWLVAGMTLDGLTAEAIADRLCCSLRLVKSIRAEPMTQMCVLWRKELRESAAEIRAEQCDHQVTRRNLAEQRAENNRLRTQLDQLLDKLIVGDRIRTCSKAHPMTPYNTYEHGGKRYCRECDRLRKAEARAAKSSV